MNELTKCVLTVKIHLTKMNKNEYIWHFIADLFVNSKESFQKGPFTCKLLFYECFINEAYSCVLLQLFFWINAQFVWPKQKKASKQASAHIYFNAVSSLIKTAGLRQKARSAG